MSSPASSRAPIFEIVEVRATPNFAVVRIATGEVMGEAYTRGYAEQLMRELEDRE